MFSKKLQSPEQINVEALKQGITDGKLGDEQRALAASKLPIITSAIELLEGGILSITNRFKEEYERRMGRKPPPGDPFMTKSDHFIATVLLLGAFVTMALDVLLSAYLARTWLDLSSLWATIVGGTGAIFLSFLCKAGILNLSYDSQNPPSTRRKLQFISLLNFAACLVLTSIVLLSRSPGQFLVFYIISVLGISLSLLGISLPLCAGALMAAAHDYNWSFRYFGDFKDAKMRLGQFRGLQQWMQTLIKNE